MCHLEVIRWPNHMILTHVQIKSHQNKSEPPHGHNLSLCLQMKKDREQRGRMARGNAEEECGEFDDLVSALRSGEVFDKDLSKLNRRRQRRHNSFNNSRERPVTKLDQNQNSWWDVWRTVFSVEENLSVKNTMTETFLKHSVFVSDSGHEDNSAFLFLLVLFSPGK